MSARRRPRDLRVSVRGYWALQAQDEGDERLEIGAVGGKAGHADRTGVGAGFLEEGGNLSSIQMGADEVRRVIRAFAVRAMTFVAFIILEQGLPLRDQSIFVGRRARRLWSGRDWNRGRWVRCGSGVAVDVAAAGQGSGEHRLSDAPARRARGHYPHGRFLEDHSRNIIRHGVKVAGLSPGARGDGIAGGVCYARRSAGGAG